MNKKEVLDAIETITNELFYRLQTQETQSASKKLIIACEKVIKWVENERGGINL